MAHQRQGGFSKGCAVDKSTRVPHWNNWKQPSVEYRMMQDQLPDAGEQ